LKRKRKRRRRAFVWTGTVHERGPGLGPEDAAGTAFESD